MRFTPIYQGMRQIVQSGDIGEVIAMDAQKSYKLGERPDWMKSRKTFGGTIPYIGVHMMDLMQWITGRQFTEVSAFQSVVGNADLGEMENVTALAFKLDNHGVASLRMDYQRPETANTHGDDRLRIVGTKGIVEYQAATGLTLITQSKPARQITDLPKPKSLTVDFIESLYGGAPHQPTNSPAPKSSAFPKSSSNPAPPPKPARSSASNIASVQSASGNTAFPAGSTIVGVIKIKKCRGS
jgi:predicted dehydrogenase